jgi:hypothetical protein
MAAKDSFHQSVKHALIKDGWSNIAPLTLRYGNTRLEIDLTAEQLFIAEKGTTQIAVEVKSFRTSSIVYEFHQAIGQYLHYRLALHRTQSPRIPYLAMPVRIYERYFEDEFFQDSLQVHQIYLILVDMSREEISQWLPHPNSI